MLHMCGNTNSHIFRDICKVQNELNFPRIIYPRPGDNLSEAGDKLSEKLFSSPNVPISCSTCVTTFVHTYFMTFVKFWEGRTFVGFPRIIYPGAIRGFIRGRGQIIRETFFVSKCSNIMLNVCHNVRSHIFHDFCEVLRRSNFCRFSSDNLSGDLSEAGDKLSEKLFSCPRKLSSHGVSSAFRGLDHCR